MTNDNIMSEKKDWEWTGNTGEDWFWVQSCILHVLVTSVLTWFTIYHYKKSKRAKLIAEANKRKGRSSRGPGTIPVGLNPRLHKMNELLPYIVSGFYLTNNVFWILRETKIDYYYNLYSCKVSVQLGAVFWCFGKAALWLLFVLRLHLAFYGSNRAYSVKKVIIPFTIYAIAAGLTGAVFGTVKQTKLIVVYIYLMFSFFFFVVKIKLYSPINQNYSTIAL